MTGVVEVSQRRPAGQFALIRLATGQQVFAELHEPAPALLRGQRVEVSVVWSCRGWRAIDVEPLEPA